MPVATKFATSGLLTEHYREHKEDFSAISEQDYEEKARDFLNAPFGASTTIEEKQRKRKGILVNEWVRYDKSTNEFAIVKADGTICTYFRPMMSSLAPSGTPRNKMHKKPSNYAYFLAECEKQ